MTTVQIGSIQIDNPDILNFINSRDISEIKRLIVNLLTEKLQYKKQSKSKWANLADKISDESLLSGKSQIVVAESKAFRENWV